MLAENELGYKNWASKVRNLLFDYGFFDVWLSQGVSNVKAFIKTFVERARVCYILQWKDKINCSDRYELYGMFKSELQLSKYLHVIDKEVFRNA